MVMMVSLYHFLLQDHHINVHKVVMAAGSRFFKDQLCKQNVQVPVILRLEDFGIELKRDAVSYIIEFVYRGEVRHKRDKSFPYRYSAVMVC